MNAAPIRRTIAVLGLIALLPVAFLLATGQLSPADAGLRAGVTLVAVAGLQRLGSWGVRRAIVARLREAAAESAQADAA